MKSKKNRIFKRLSFVFMVAAVMVCMAVPAFAAVDTDGAITTEMLEPILDGLKSNIAVIIPIGIGIFAIIMGIRFIPKIFNMFSKG